MAAAETSGFAAEPVPAGLQQREQETQIAKFLLLCGNLAWLLLGAVMVVLALFVVLQENLPLSIRLPWLVVMLVISLVRLLFLRHWKHSPTNHTNVNRRICQATLLSFTSACCFGALAYFAVSEDNPLTSLLVVMIVTSMAASATAAVSHLLPMYVLSIFPIMLPMAYRMAEFDQSGYHWIAGLILLYLLICLGISRSIRASIMQSINMRFENRSLLHCLREEKQRAEVALEREEKANLAKSRFLAAASHDLRQPLHSLRLFTATLKLQTRDTKHMSLVSQIDSSVQSLEELFNALLDISKLDAGTLTVNREHIPLNSLLAQIEGEFKPLASENSLNFNVEYADHVIHTDALLLERLIRNLASNAIRYTQHGGIDITAKMVDGRVWLSIADTGVGIPEEDHLRVFEEFVQLGNTARDRNQGIGLGLSIVKRLAVLLSVEVRIESTLGQGTTFQLGIPLGDRMQCQSLPVGLFDSPAEELDSLFVLVIDDEEQVCLAIEGLLESWGCIVMTSCSGATALKQLDEISETPDVIVSDYRLRDGENGGDVIQAIRQKTGENIPSIILTGDIAPDRLREIKALGYPMLHKPCDPEALKKLLAQATALPVVPATIDTLYNGRDRPERLAQTRRRVGER